jgi:hypothetical protein
VSSFSNPHHIYLFSLKNGKKKLAYGQSPQDALDILGVRLTDHEMANINADEYKKIPQRDLQKYVNELG